MGTCDDTKAVVLHNLELAEVSRLEIGREDGSGKIDDGGSQRFIGQE